MSPGQHIESLKLPAVQTYLMRMVEAARFGWSMTANTPETPDFTQLGEYLVANLASVAGERADKVRRLLQAFGTHYLAHHPGSAVRACHAVSHGFRRTWAQNPVAELYPLQITIGAVYVRGQNVFDVTLDSMRRTVEMAFPHRYGHFR